MNHIINPDLPIKFPNPGETLNIETKITMSPDGNRYVLSLYIAGVGVYTRDFFIEGPTASATTIFIK